MGRNKIHLHEQQRPIDRIEEFAKYLISLRLIKSVGAFERVCGLSPKYISNMSRSERGSFGVEILSRVYDVFPILNLEWAVTGNGKMTKTTPTNEVLFAITQRIIDTLSKPQKFQEKVGKNEEKNGGFYLDQNRSAEKH